jgi:hypothetical protein
MAETIPEHHIPTLLGSPSLDITQTSIADFVDDVFDDSEFPFAHGMYNGVKCCTKCGATKTPQWREGPFGPKTLCNACGVKRTRKMRAEADGNKRRKPSPLPTIKTSVAKPKVVRSVSPVPIHDVLDNARDEASTEGNFTSPRRPIRKAAEEAAVKTARYARTGEWAGALPNEGTYAAMPAMEATTSSSDLSLPSSNCPEEVSWTPLAAEAAARSGLTSMPMDCYAAVNLMTISLRDQQVLEEIGTTPPSPPASSTVRIKDSSARSQFSDMAALCKIPPAKAMELIRLNQEVENAVNEAHAASAAVAAVAAVLATKQATALRARELAVAATKRLRRFAIELDTQFGIKQKSLPRIRTSLKKNNVLTA